MTFLNSIIIAFGMYSKLPMPRVDWNKENMKYAMCFFPWVGAVTGGIFYLWGTYGAALPMGKILFTVVLVMIPLLITGGIHLDGLLDTADALSSYQPMERRLEILKDSHAGAFAIIICVSWFFCYFGVLSELTPDLVPVIAMGFFLSRALSGFGITWLRCAKNSGLAATFSAQADRNRAGLLLALQAILCGALMVFYRPAAGGAAVAAALLCFLWYRRMAYHKFGGITGDLAGCFLQVCELSMAAAVVVTGYFL